MKPVKISKPLTVAIYSGTIPSTTFIENLIEGLSESGLRIILFGRKTGNVKYNSNVEIIATPKSGIGLGFFIIKESFRLFLKSNKLFYNTFGKLRETGTNLRSIIKLAGVLLPIINRQPDIFHIQWAKVIHRYPQLFELLKSKIVLSLRGAHINYSPVYDTALANSYRKYFPKINAFHAVSRAIAEESVKYGANPDRIRIIYSSIRDELMVKSLPELKNGDFVRIISIGRFHWKKGYHYALDAMKILKAEGISFEYSIVAQGKIPEEILFLIEEYALTEEVKIIPGLSYKTLVEKLRQQDLLLLPSVEEGIANVVLEAMAVGVPVITTDCGGMNEVITDGVNGYITEVRHPEQIASRVTEYLGIGKEEKKKIITNARQTIEDKFSRSRQIMEFGKLYHSLINAG